MSKKVDFSDLMAHEVRDMLLATAVVATQSHGYMVSIHKHEPTGADVIIIMTTSNKDETTNEPAQTMPQDNSIPS